MQFKDMYAKAIDRPIDAVVKAGSVEHLANELDEYVVTPELEGHLERFYDEYNDPDATGNGAWISGFFGSGKSHMLKILAVMLQDEEVAGKPALDYILPKIETPSLRAAMEVARTKHPSESVLFNIDVDAPNSNRTEAAGLLAAFIKVFNRHCGYFDGDQQFIAELEYDLDREGKFEDFKTAVSRISGKPWEDVRKSALIRKKDISAAFDEVCGNAPGSTANVVKDYQEAFKPSIHSFAERVHDYINAHEPGFRLNFFVDEVGQFIAQNVNLMVNLQSVAEELNTVCGGASWVVVTSQENMEDIVGQMTERSANDFSRITDRFKIKMQLTSKDAKTVIQQRLLAKDKAAIPEIEAIYAEHSQDFRVLFDFADGSKTYKTYQTMEEFVDTYPFVPYQFDLFITAMRGLSGYNAFTGRHHSTGARSMLGVFQDVGAKLARGQASTEEETLASFDAMFEGLRNSIKGEVCGQITIAENQLSDNPMAIRVLKALFLVKYCKDFKATAKNLRVLLYGSFRENTSSLEQQIKDVLHELEHQLYARRSANSNIYEYLTDEEKDIEKDIRNTPISNSDIESSINELFESVLGAKRVSYQNGSFQHNFSYNLKINNNNQGQQRNDLSVNILTGYTGSGILDVVSADSKTLAVVLQNANDFLNDVRTFEQTKKFAQISSASDEMRQAIIVDKRKANQALHGKLVVDFTNLLTEAVYNAGGVDVTSSISGSGKDCVVSGLQELIRRAYTGLQQLKSNVTDNDVYQATLAGRSLLNTGTSEYVESVFNRIGLLSGSGAVTIGGDGLASLNAVFTKNEFGWPEIYVRHAVAQLYAAGRVEVRKAGSLVEGVALANALKKNIEMDKLVVSKMASITPQQKAEVNQAYRAVTGVNPTEDDAKAIAFELANFLHDFANPLLAVRQQAKAYPFSEDYEQKIQTLDSAAKAAEENWTWIVDPFPSKAGEIAAAKEDLTKMKQFVDGAGVGKRWLDIKEFCDSQLHEAKELGLSEVMDGSDLLDELNVLTDPQCYKSSAIPRTAGNIRKINEQMEKAKDQLRESVVKQFDVYKQSFLSSYDINIASTDNIERFNGLFDEAKASVFAIDSVHQIKACFENFKSSQASLLLTLVKPPAVQPAAGDGQNGKSADDRPVLNKPITTSLSSVRATGYSKPAIESLTDIDDYLLALRSALEAEINQGHVITK